MKDPLKQILARRSSSPSHTTITLCSPTHHYRALAPCPQTRQSLMILQLSNRDPSKSGEGEGLVSKLEGHGARPVGWSSLAPALPPSLCHNTHLHASSRGIAYLRMANMGELVVPSAWLGVRGERGRCEAREVFWLQIVKTGSIR
jgi:hypothetical protein